MRLDVAIGAAGGDLGVRLLGIVDPALAVEIDALLDPAIELEATGGGNLSTVLVQPLDGVRDMLEVGRVAQDRFHREVFVTELGRHLFKRNDRAASQVPIALLPVAATLGRPDVGEVFLVMARSEPAFVVHGVLQRGEDHGLVIEKRRFLGDAGDDRCVAALGDSRDEHVRGDHGPVHLIVVAVANDHLNDRGGVGLFLEGVGHLVDVSALDGLCQNLLRPRRLWERLEGFLRVFAAIRLRRFEEDIHDVVGQQFLVSLIRRKR